MDDILGIGKSMDVKSGSIPAGCKMLAQGEAVTVGFCIV